MDKETDRERDRALNGAYDDQIIFGDEQAVYDGDNADAAEDD